ncbi:hypothetical protein HMPREF3138_20805 [Serratia sp. HMSC15F11]|nr:hypothetical protein HMPREF3138_20805 [Serratia sp. HMSC15F11]
MAPVCLFHSLYYSMKVVLLVSTVKRGGLSRKKVMLWLCMIVRGGSSFIFPMSVNMSLILLTYILMRNCQSCLTPLEPILLGIKMPP